MKLPRHSLEAPRRSGGDLAGGNRASPESSARFLKQYHRRVSSGIFCRAWLCDLPELDFQGPLPSVCAVTARERACGQSG